MKKFCIFCGEKPISKSREHIIPLWLLRATGKPDRKVNLGLDFGIDGTKKRSFSFNSLHFPACSACNNIFSKLEAANETIIDKILTKQEIDQFEITLLLDWLDKIRVGLWLGYHQLDNNLFNIKPNYYVAHRIRNADRMFALYRIKENFKGVSFGFIQSPVFSYNPICFFIFINKICIFNLSTTFLFAHNLGFPYPEKILYDGNIDGLRINKMNIGKHKIKKPIYRKPLILPSFEVYQTIWNNDIIDYCNDYYNTDYVKANTLSSKLNCSKIFLNRHNNITIVEDKIDTNTKEFNILELDKKITKLTINTLNDLISRIEFTEDTPNETVIKTKKRYKGAIQANNIQEKLRLNLLDQFYTK